MVDCKVYSVLVVLGRDAGRGSANPVEMCDGFARKYGEVGTLRVIAGRLRGRRLARVADGVRPTSDRVRESVFARLGQPPGVHVLDLFAGTGSLGIEALSRGAESLVSVDRSKKVVAALRQTLEELEIAHQARVLSMEARGAIRRLSKSGERFDLVFVDPPYDDVEATARVLGVLAGSGLLAPDAVVVVECATRNSIPSIPGLVARDERVYGDTLVRWLTPEPRTRAGPSEDRSGGAARR